MDVDLTWYWLIGGAILILLEIFLPGVFLIWIGVGTLIVGVVVQLANGALSIEVQLILLSISILFSIGVGVFLDRRMIAKRANSRTDDGDPNTGLASLIGAKAQVMEVVDANTTRISIYDTRYTATCTKPVTEDQTVIVTGILRKQLIISPTTPSQVDLPPGARYADDGGTSFR